MRRLAVAGAILLACTAHGVASEVVTTTDGRQILLRDDGKYEIVKRGSDEAGGGGYSRMSLTDLKLDIDSLHGKKVEVTAKLMSMGGMVMLSDPQQMMDSNPIIADAERLSREDRRFLLTKCETECRVTVRGTVTSVMFQSGLQLDRLVR